LAPVTPSKAISDGRVTGFISKELPTDAAAPIKVAIPKPIANHAMPNNKISMAVSPIKASSVVSFIIYETMTDDYRRQTD
jgi:hypothetical protein